MSIIVGGILAALILAAIGAFLHIKGVAPKLQIVLFVCTLFTIAFTIFHDNLLVSTFISGLFMGAILVLCGVGIRRFSHNVLDQRYRFSKYVTATGTFCIF